MAEKILYNTNGTRTFIAPGPFTYEAWSRGGTPANSSADPGGSGGYHRKVIDAPPGSSWTLVISNSDTRIYPTGQATSYLIVDAGNGSTRGRHSVASTATPDVAYEGQNGYVDGGGVRQTGNSPLPNGSYATVTTEDGGKGGTFGVPSGSPAAGARTYTDAPGNGQIRITYDIPRRAPRHSFWL